MDHLDEEIRDRVILIGGKVSGVDCPHCEFRSREVELSSSTVREIRCPECSGNVLTEDQMSQLRQADKLRWASH